jgi:hypothetical protein
MALHEHMVHVAAHLCEGAGVTGVAWAAEVVPG